MSRRLRVLIVCHDAGGAEIVSAWCRRHKSHEYRYVLAGPARAIFRRKIAGVSCRSAEFLSAMVRKSDFVLTGTSWASEIEKKAIAAAKKNKVKVCSFLDHWVDYPARFQLRGKRVLPDEIWVGDREALKRARRYFPHCRLRLKVNPYFQDIRKKIMESPRPPLDKNGLHILYICEPISEQSIRQYGKPDHWGYTEQEAIVKFLEKVAGDAKKKVSEIKVRLHPAESGRKYDFLLRRFPGLPIKIGSGRSLIEDCLRADWIVGCESMALVTGLLSGRRVFCAIPDPGIPCSLPHKQITRFT